MSRYASVSGRRSRDLMDSDWSGQLEKNEPRRERTGPELGRRLQFAWVEA